MIAALLALQIVSSAPPVSPGEAARILRDGPGLSNRTASPAPITERGPVVVIIGGSPTAGPFGEFKPFGPTAPLSHGPYVFRSPAPYRFRPRFEPVQVTSTMRALRTRR
jgi:hypothetical protein